jgi:hypothetical protein
MSSLFDPSWESTHPRLRLEKHSSGYWQGAYRERNCLARKFGPVWRVHLQGFLQPGSYCSLEHAENYLMRRIDALILEQEASDLRRLAEEPKPRPGFSQRQKAKQATSSQT